MVINPATASRVLKYCFLAWRAIQAGVKVKKHWDKRRKK